MVKLGSSLDNHEDDFPVPSVALPCFIRHFLPTPSPEPEEKQKDVQNNSISEGKGSGVAARPPPPTSKRGPAYWLSVLRSEVRGRIPRAAVGGDGAPRERGAPQRGGVPVRLQGGPGLRRPGDPGLGHEGEFEKRPQTRRFGVLSRKAAFVDL